MRRVDAICAMLGIHAPINKVYSIQDIFFQTRQFKEMGHIGEDHLLTINADILRLLLADTSSGDRSKIDATLKELKQEVHINMTMRDDRSVKAGRDIVGSQNVTGDGNMTQMRDTFIQLTSGDDVDIGAELSGLRETLLALNTPDRGKIERALQDAEEEATKDEPSKDEVGAAIERAVKYAKGASDFGDHVGKIADRLGPVVSWLGNNWAGILAIAGIAV